MTPDQYCEQKAASAGSSGRYACMFLPSAQRRAIIALHALCRELHEVVEQCSDPQLAAATLAWWRTEIAGLRAGTPTHPATRALQPALARFGLDAQQLEEILAGFERDLMQVRYEDHAALALYCEGIAGGEAALGAQICGYSDARTRERARELGVAVQLARILRDVGAAARRNRIYLPMAELKAHGVAAADILQARHGDSFTALMRAETSRARAALEHAASAIPAADRRLQRPALIMARLYRALLDEIARDGFRVLAQRTSLTPMRKLWLASRTWLAT